MKKQCWVVCEDGLIGTEKQCLAVAEALGHPYVIKRFWLNFPWNILSPYIGFECSWSFSPAFEGPWPDIVIASGRKSIAASRYIKRMSGGKTFTVQIQDPRIPTSRFDLVAVPAHDPARGENVIVTQGAPNAITPALLKNAAKDFPELTKLPSPRIAVLIGGNSKAYNMSKETTHTLCDQLLNLEGGVMVTASRRTGEMNAAILKERLQGDGIFFWDGHGENPYHAMLGIAEFILVTADSASMISEACTTGKPVYMIELEGGHPRIGKLHENLLNHGALRCFEGALESWKYEPLNDAKMVAETIRKRLSE